MEFDYNKLKRDFNLKINGILDHNISFRHLLYEIFMHGSAYVVGGFLRDLINKKDSRDLDIIIDLNHELLISIIEKSGIQFIINRHKGIKLLLDNLQVDMWSIENNWAFKTKLVKLNDDNKLESIAKGCFYNYDALVINLNSKKQKLNVKFYADFVDKKELDILQSNPQYKILNPTNEANILRAFYLKLTFNINYSGNTKRYLFNKLGQVRDSDKDPAVVLMETREKYPKYQVLTEATIREYINQVIIDSEINSQLLFNL